MAIKTVDVPQAKESSRPPDKSSGTVFLAESGRLGKLRDDLKKLGFVIRDMLDTEAGQTVPEPVIIVVDSAGWTAAKEDIRAFSLSSHYRRPVIQIDDAQYEDGGPETPSALIWNDPAYFIESWFACTSRPPPIIIRAMFGWPPWPIWPMPELVPARMS